MIGIQKAVFLTMATDNDLLELLGLVVPSEDMVEISKRLVPTPPQSSGDELDHLIHFRFPRTNLLNGSPEMENRPVQFRIWSSDNSLSTQQKIADRLQELFVNQSIRIPDLRQSSLFYYSFESEIPGVVFGRYGWLLELEIHTRVKISVEGG